MLTETIPTTGQNQPNIAVWTARKSLFDWLMVVLSIFFVSGLLLDGWAHAHGKVDNSFFTPWHAVFYSGFGLIALLLAADTGLAFLHGQGFSMTRRPGYELAHIGVPLFALGGVGDLVWHQLFGIERGIEALISPTHLLLVTSMALIVSAPFRAAGLVKHINDWQTQLRSVLSLTMTLSVITFITEFANPIVEPVVDRYSRTTEIAAGSMGFMIYPGLLMGASFLLLKRGKPLPGALTLMYTLNASLLSVLNDTFWAIPVAACTGIIADALILLLRPSPHRRVALHLFGFFVPIVFGLSYMLAIHQNDKIMWSVHLWGGAVFLAGASGLLLSLLVPCEQ